MDRYVMRNPLTDGVALIPASSMPWHKANGWVRVSDAISQDAMAQVDLGTYADAVDLDEVKPEPKSTKSSQEK